MTARTQALQTLSEWQGSRKPIALFLDRQAAKLTPRDRALVQSLVYGVLRHQQSLDEVITRFSKHPLAKMKPLTLTALRLGSYQLLYMDRVPPSAAINETIASLKAVRQPKWLTGFVNGLLRTIARNLETVQEQLIRQPAANHPQWLTERWGKHFGHDRMLAICARNNTIPPVSLRVNTSLCTREQLLERFHNAGLRAQPSSLSPPGILLEEVGQISALPGYQEGLFQVQDIAAQLAGLLMDPGRRNNRFLDACAGLGGKTSHIAQHLHRDSSLTAIEPDARRFSLLKANLARLSLTERVEKKQSSLEELVTERPPPFDAILLDAPCSGTGVIGRQPDIRWNRSPQDLLWYQRHQKQLLEYCWHLLQPGGRILYATCSLEPEENQEVTADFLARHPDCTCLDARQMLPAEAAHLVSPEGFFHPLPDAQCDGFFAALLVQSGEPLSPLTIFDSTKRARACTGNSFASDTA